MRIDSVAFTVVVLLSTGARAELDDEPTPHASATVPDATFQAVRGRAVVLRTVAGAELSGELLAVDASTATLVLPTREVISVRKSEIAQVRLNEVSATPPTLGEAKVIAAAPPQRERHFALNLGLAPAIDLDLDYGLFHGFLNGSLVLPMASAGDLLGFSIGAGVSWRPTTHSRWRIDAFVHIAPARMGDVWLIGVGAGLGAHYTYANGFTIGFKVPILGYSGCANSSSSSGSDPCSSWTSAGGGVAGFYLSSVMGLPIVSLGYRF